MSYNFNELPKYINTAGKITIVTALFGVVIFAAAFLLNLGAKEISAVSAQGVATTSVLVLNTPPAWVVDAQEEFESSTSSPTNSGNEIAWVATATDSDGLYYLLICDSAAAPTSTDGGAPQCVSGLQWAVSTATVSGTEARAATTTLDVFPFDNESNDWYAWVCDGIATSSRCNLSPRQGTATTASPFFVNHRPNFISYFDNSELINAVPGDVVTFYATSSDPDVVDTDDTMQLIVCSTASFSTSTATCNDTTLATSTFQDSSTMPLQATYSIFTPTRDSTYGAFGFIVDEHGHIAATTTQNSILTVNNVAPTILGADINLNGGSPLVLTQEAGETTGFTLSFTVNDNNSCSTTPAIGEPEIQDYQVAVYRSGVGSSTCDGTGTNYDPNNCYDSGVATSTWNLVCTQAPGSCTYNGVDDFDDDVVYNCTFPLWYVADPTNGTSTQTFYFDEEWTATIAGIDDNNATGTPTDTAFPVELNAFMSFSLDTLAIPYGALEPGQRTDPLNASTTLRATGNVGLDQLLSGESMCEEYTTAVKCNTSATSTIADQFQVFATSSDSYGSATSSGNTVSSTTVKELELNVLKSTSTATQTTGVTWWGIEVPDTITKAGSYTGENTIWGVSGEPSQWY